MTDSKFEIGNKIRELRKQRNLTQEKLAELSSLSENFISRIERGYSSSLSVNNLIKISEALGVKPAEFFVLSQDRGVNYEALKTKIEKMSVEEGEKTSRVLLDVLSLLDEKRG